jgi:hypothetical protein
MIEELIALSDMLEQIHLDPLVSDCITWKLTQDGTYSARSAYNFQFEGMVRCKAYKCIWRTWAPSKCKIFLFFLKIQDLPMDGHATKDPNWLMCFCLEGGKKIISVPCVCDALKRPTTFFRNAPGPGKSGRQWQAAPTFHPCFHHTGTWTCLWWIGYSSLVKMFKIQQEEKELSHLQP